MLEKLLSNHIYYALRSRFDLEFVFEVRIRANAPIVINYKGINTIVKNEAGKIIIGTKNDIERVVQVASNYSLYTVENQLKQAFITAEKGYRIGLSGEIVSECGASGIRSIKNIYSVNIRVPHKILNCSFKVFNYIYSNNEIKNTLIISPPGAGKTTYLRDICYQFSKLEKPHNILLIDERYEIAGVKNGEQTIDVGGFVDILSGASKAFGLSQGIRSLKPDIIVTDEIGTKEDFEAVTYAINSGVKVITTIHSENIEMLYEKEGLKSIIDSRYFDRYIVLSNDSGVGQCIGIYDKNLKCLYC